MSRDGNGNLLFVLRKSLSTVLRLTRPKCELFWKCKQSR